MKTFKQYPLAAAVSAIISVTLPCGAMAQAALEEVIVTAQKREQNLQDVSSIEVLLGPQGTLFGRNTPAGAVTINSVQPDHEGSGFLQATGGDDDLIGASGAKSFSIIEDELAVRFTGFTMQRDGFVDIVGGEIDAINDRDRWGARFQALYTPNDDVTDAFIVTAGLRWTREEKDMTNTFTQDASPSPPPPPPFDPGWGFWIFPPLPPRSDVDEDIDDDQVTGTFKLSWLMNDLTMFYASYGTGYKSGGINTDRISVTIDVAFDAEKSKSYEMGMKADITAFAYAEAIYTDERMTDVNNDPENTTETLPWSTCAPAWSSSNTQPV